MLTLVLLLVPVSLFVVGALVFLAVKRKSQSKQVHASSPATAKVVQPSDNRSPLRGVESLTREQRLDQVRRVVDQMAEGWPGEVFSDLPGETVEWRGKVSECDARILFKRLHLELSVKAGQGFGDLRFRWDKKKRHNKQRPAPWSDDDLTDVFVGPGVYFHEYPSNVDDVLARYGALPSDLATRVVSSMPKHQVEDFWVRDNGSIRVTFAAHATRLRDLIQRSRSQLELMGDVAKVLKNLPNPAQRNEEIDTDGENLEAIRHTLECVYCKTLYFFAPSVSGCPNCGAAPHS